MGWEGKGWVGKGKGLVRGKIGEVEGVGGKGWEWGGSIRKLIHLL